MGSRTTDVWGVSVPEGAGMAGGVCARTGSPATAILGVAVSAPAGGVATATPSRTLGEAPRICGTGGKVSGAGLSANESAGPPDSLSVSTSIAGDTLPGEGFEGVATTFGGAAGAGCREPARPVGSGRGDACAAAFSKVAMFPKGARRRVSGVEAGTAGWGRTRSGRVVSAKNFAVPSADGTAEIWRPGPAVSAPALAGCCWGSAALDGRRPVIGTAAAATAKGNACRITGRGSGGSNGFTAKRRMTGSATN